MGDIALLLYYEDWAYLHGYRNETQISLVADFLYGLNKMDFSLFVLPSGIHICKSVRDVFYRAGKDLANLKSEVEDSDIINALSKLFHKYYNELKNIKGDPIFASTGDCRGACQYNTGDRSEYRNYGW